MSLWSLPPILRGHLLICLFNRQYLIMHLGILSRIRLVYIVFGNRKDSIILTPNELWKYNTHSA